MSLRHGSRVWMLVLGLAILLGAPDLVAQGTGTELKVAVVGPDGAGVNGAIVEGRDAAGRLSVGQADAAGSAVLRLPGRGRYVITVRAIGFDLFTTDVDLASAGGTVMARLQRARQLAPVAVIGGGQRAGGLPVERSTPTSILGGEQLAREPVAFSQEVLRKLPGVYRAEFNQGIISGDIGIRGFNTESEIASTKLLIDGIPSNINAGVSEMNAIFPLEIGEIEVVRGTSDPRFGQFNLAGNVQVTTRDGGRGFTTRVTSGSFGTTEAQALLATSARGFSQTLFAGTRRATGYRANSGLEKWTLSGKWGWTSADDRWKARLIARRHALDTDAPGYLTAAASRATPRASPAFSATDGGTVDVGHLSAHLDGPIGDAVWSVKAYSQRFERVRFVRFTAAGAQQERIEDERQRGLIATMSWAPAQWAKHAVRLSGGFDIQQQDNLQFRYRTADRVRQTTLRDYDFTLDNQGAFLQVAGDPVQSLRLTAGLRLDRFDGRFNNRGTSTTLPIFEYGTIPQAKAGLLWRITGGTTAYANYGRAFQIGTGIAAYGTTPLTWSKNDGTEFGVMTRPTAGSTFRAGLWQQVASDEVRLRFDNSGDSENIGRTRRRGLDVEGTWVANSLMTLWASGTTQRAILVEPGLTNATARGKRLNHVPDWTAKAGIDIAPARGLTIAAWAFGQGDYELTPQNDRGRFGAQRIVNLDLSYRWRGVAAGVGVQNLFNRYVEYVWWDGTQTLHSPAAGRATFVSMTVDW